MTLISWSSLPTVSRTVATSRYGTGSSGKLFFEYAGTEGVHILTKDKRRRFSESERIAIYREVDGVCQECLKLGHPDDEARVPWSEYEADHVVPHTKGGPTVIDNAQVLCRAHNLAKGASV